MKVDKSKLLTREKFVEHVFARDKHLCVFCKKPAVDAHHILDRKLFNDGGYYLDNGASVCSHHHLECEFTLISVEQVRAAAGIQHIILPNGFNISKTYDKWGNEIFESFIIGGPLVNDDGMRRALIGGRKIQLLIGNDYVKDFVQPTRKTGTT